MKKTVLLTTVSNEFRKMEDWIVVDLSPERDMLNALAAELSNRKELFQIFKDAKINLSIDWSYGESVKIISLFLSLKQKIPDLF